MTALGAPVEHRRAREVGRRCAAYGVIAAAVAVFALAFVAGTYRYRVFTAVLSPLCGIGGRQCPEPTFARTAWHGPWSTAAVVVTLLAALLAGGALAWTARRRDLALLTVGVSAVGLACAVASGRAIPRLADVSPLLHDLGGPGGTLRYGDVVTDSLGWPYWASLVTAAAGFGCACLALLLDRTRAPRA